ncbi:serine hydrolase domain-containing protein [Nonomuraea jiangxiensis]|uniref:D-alanyl-D-alanine carboxypeptidase n=1 Tax=Nonomuraea jiangxiensis TaxID=633440 RepID=A0A1G9A1V3_9ACTN|nr:serine hydrolase domain-containing protein [Nonomuraea jiangxiensis]SDK21326.1 D-alanyl-D-alanine carboxypeptidase [Nonomuraea jiangxiensis]
MTNTMRRRLITVVAALSTVLATGTSAVAAHASRAAGAEGRSGVDRAAVTKMLKGLVAERASTAALIRVRDGRREWTAVAGTAELAPGRPANPAGYFRIGSVTKTFVATVLLQLCDEGRLRLDDPVERYLPGAVPDGARITVRRLLNHTSGLHDYMSEPGYSTNRWRGAARFRSYDAGRLLSVAFAKPPTFPPGAGWSYSNTNYVVAGLLIEKLTGHSYEAEIERRILRPLRLTQTSLPGDRAGLPRPHAHGYHRLPEGRTVDATRMNPSLDWAAGEMISTTRDLERFFQALLTGRLTSPAALAAMRTVTATDAGFDYGLGLQRYTLPCGRGVWGHSGELIGYLTFAFRADDGRQLTLSVNPYTRKPSQEQVFAIATLVFCP